MSGAASPTCCRLPSPEPCGVSRLTTPRRMEKKVHKRRRLLSYLREVDFEAYSKVISQLGLADAFGTSVCGPAVRCVICLGACYSYKIVCLAHRSGTTFHRLGHYAWCYCSRSALFIIGSLHHRVRGRHDCCPGVVVPQSATTCALLAPCRALQTGTRWARHIRIPRGPLTWCSAVSLPTTLSSSVCLRRRSSAACRALPSLPVRLSAG